MYDVEINGRVRKVAIEPAGPAYRVTIDGRERTVDAVRLDGTTLSLLIDRESWTIGISTSAEGEQLVSVDGVQVRAVLNDRRGRWGRRAGLVDGRSAAGPQRIMAPMPGKVVRILVQPGDTVAARQPVLVVEAMKMENELRSPKDGIIAEIRVTEGTSVDAGSLLAVVE